MSPHTGRLYYRTWILQNHTFNDKSFLTPQDWQLCYKFLVQNTIECRSGVNAQMNSSQFTFAKDKVVDAVLMMMPTLMIKIIVRIFGVVLVSRSKFLDSCVFFLSFIFFHLFLFYFPSSSLQHGSGLTRYLMFNGNIYHALYLHILTGGRSGETGGISPP